ncbi:phage head closure protein [Clostridium beijerinckii]|uniref:phage head closure protein n=1 Tax=Clostridium beijerinckii TaxID=1520 RepID=UPI001494F20E|nr:phage head closure protein [Clostridium beijerinckii]NOW08054.1 SPP1 family predicted phage head-tail adaptor [Clostridium beijerinckii]NYC05670.1 SPP1 family predicted phage head-tail adaptor [Clostridium beijerinckii]
MAYDYELTLIKHTFKKDELMNQIPEEIKTDLYCDLKSIGRNEYYNAASQGLKPEIIFVIHKYEYNGEREILFEENRYKVIRTYSADFEEIELTCEKVV